MEKSRKCKTDKRVQYFLFIYISDVIKTKNTFLFFFFHFGSFLFGCLFAVLAFAVLKTEIFCKKIKLKILPKDKQIVFGFINYYSKRQLSIFLGHCSKPDDKLGFISLLSLYVHPPISRIGISNIARLEFPTYFFPCIDPNEWWIKISLHKLDSTPRPFRLEAPSETTRP